MGTWGTGILEDDTALDFLEELRAERTPTGRLRDALEAAVAAEYLDFSAAQDALVSAGIVDAVLCGGDLAGEDDVLRAWLARLDGRALAPLRDLAAQACRRVIGPGSELQELWAENAEEFPAWKAGIEAIAARLSTA